MRDLNYILDLDLFLDIFDLKQDDRFTITGNDTIYRFHMKDLQKLEMMSIEFGIKYNTWMPVNNEEIDRILPISKLLSGDIKLTMVEDKKPTNKKICGTGTFKCTCPICSDINIEESRYELEDLEGPELSISREVFVNSIRKFIKQEVNIAIKEAKDDL